MSCEEAEIHRGCILFTPPTAGTEQGKQQDTQQQLYCDTGSADAVHGRAMDHFRTSAVITAIGFQRKVKCVVLQRSYFLFLLFSLSSRPQLFSSTIN